MVFTSCEISSIGMTVILSSRVYFWSPGYMTQSWKPDRSTNLIFPARDSETPLTNWGEGRFAALPRTEQSSDRVNLKRCFYLTDGFWSGNHGTIFYLEYLHVNWRYSRIIINRLSRWYCLCGLIEKPSVFDTFYGPTIKNPLLSAIPVMHYVLFSTFGNQLYVIFLTISH